MGTPRSTRAGARRDVRRTAPPQHRLASASAEGIRSPAVPSSPRPNDPSPDPARRAALLHLKLATLVREHLGHEVDAVPASFARGGALTVATTAWVLVDEQPERGLGPALAWALRHGATELHVLAESATGTLQRQADAVALPVRAWHVAERTLLAAIAGPLPSRPELPAEHDALRDLIVLGGAEPVVEFGVLSGEVAGLEVCRVVADPTTGEIRLEVGVGAHDREAFQLLHGDRPSVEALADVVGTVAGYRTNPARSHPLSRLAPERALRHRLVHSPGVLVIDGVPADEVVPVQPPVPRTNLKDPSPAVAVATLGGRRVTVVCSVGIDLGVVPYATDARLATGTDDVVVVLPERDAIEIQRLLAAATRPPVRVVPVA